jgi:hypothetical protein
MHRETVAAGQRELADLRQRLTEMTETTIPELKRDLEATGAPPIEE